MSIVTAINESIELREKILKDEFFINTVETISNKIIAAYAHGGKLLIAGNGGSAADAQHFAAEIVGQFQLKRKGHPAIALTVDTSILTAWSNDYSYETAIARQVGALGDKEDVLFVISTSGNSVNLMRAVEMAQNKGLLVVGLLGRDGGQLREQVDLALVVPSDSTPRIQECHIMIIHSICEALDAYFVGKENE